MKTITPEVAPFSWSTKGSFYLYSCKPGHKRSPPESTEQVQKKGRHLLKENNDLSRNVIINVDMENLNQFGYLIFNHSFGGHMENLGKFLNHASGVATISANVHFYNISYISGKTV